LSRISIQLYLHHRHIFQAVRIFDLSATAVDLVDLAVGNEIEISIAHNTRRGEIHRRFGLAKKFYPLNSFKGRGKTQVQDGLRERCILHTDQSILIKV
jgi:hypothetical protein